jgi:Fic-DOC domain mobile mystery protein B
VLSVEFLRELHRRMFGKTWRWAGTFRKTGKTIGVLASQIPEAVRNLLENVRAQIAGGGQMPDEMAIRFHHELVRIHPFANGNGRHARQLTDLLLQQLGRPPFSWGSADLDRVGTARTTYIAALREADRGDLDPLRRFVRS